MYQSRLLCRYLKSNCHPLTCIYERGCNHPGVVGWVGSLEGCFVGFFVLYVAKPPINPKYLNCVELTTGEVHRPSQVPVCFYILLYIYSHHVDIYSMSVSFFLFCVEHVSLHDGCNGGRHGEDPCGSGRRRVEGLL